MIIQVLKDPSFIFPSLFLSALISGLVCLWVSDMKVDPKRKKTFYQIAIFTPLLIISPSFLFLYLRSLEKDALQPKTLMQAWTLCESANGQPTGKPFSHYVLGLVDLGVNTVNNLAEKENRLLNVRNAKFLMANDEHFVDTPLVINDKTIGAVVCLSNVSHEKNHICMYDGGVTFYNVGTEADITLVDWNTKEVIAREHVKTAQRSTEPCEEYASLPAGSNTKDYPTYYQLEINGKNFEDWVTQYQKSNK